MLVGMWTKIMPIRYKVANQLLRILVRIHPSRKEKPALCFILLQRLRDRGKTFKEFVACKYKRDVLLTPISANDGTPVNRNSIDFFSVLRREQVDQRSRSIHRRLVGAIVTIIIVIHGQVTLKLTVLVGLVQL